jgi:protein SCO1/2
MSKWKFTCAGALVALGLGCGRAPDRYEATAAARRFPIEGTVRGVGPDRGEVTLQHGAIPGLMDAMTMTFPIKERWIARAAAAGDRLTGTLVVDDGRSWIEDAVMTRPPQGADAGAATAPDGVGPAAGTPLPEAPLVNQAGRPVRARDFAGRDVIVTFIYTRCPMPDFCPLMLARLNEVAARLEKAGRRDEVQMIAISIDPGFDSPAVLEAYGRAHIKELGDDPFHRWSLLTGTPENVRTWATRFALDYEPDGKEIAHGLRTAVADRDGKIVGLLRGNDWSVDQLMALLPAHH